MQSIVTVNLSEAKVSDRCEDVLVAFSLGSCVGVALWDPVRKAGGLGHIVLPSEKGRKHDPKGPCKYADTGVPHLVKSLKDIGCDLTRMKAWIAGGAHVLKDLAWPLGDIGAANVMSVIGALKDLGIQNLCKDIGGTYGRTMRLYIGTGRATVSSVNFGERDI